MHRLNPIAAISTPKGTGALAVIRCSGPGVHAIVSECLEKSHASLPGHAEARLCWFVHPQSKERIDQVVLTVYHSPKSYTGEDMVEISCHGGMQTTRSIMAVLLEEGCWLAQPGEYTRRAFMNGKMNLFQAEAVNDVVQARTEKQRKMALFALDKKASGPFFNLQKRLEDWLMRTEATIEFPEEDDPGVFDINRLTQASLAMKAEMDRLLADAGRGQRIRQGLLMPIAGPPNAGKSSFFNWLCQNERVIVDAHPGTTRDAVEEELEIAGTAVRVVDTAGIRGQSGRVEALGIEKTRAYLREADLIIWMHDRSKPAGLEEKTWIREFDAIPSIHIQNKIDLPPCENPDEGLLVSVKNDTGLEDVLSIIEEKIKAATAVPKDQLLISLTQRNCLLHAHKATTGLLRLLETGETREEIVSEELKEILNALEPLGGRVTDEELLNRIFGEFCIGK